MQNIQKILSYDQLIPLQKKRRLSAFYTPQDIANQMIEDSLISYLTNCGFSPSNVVEFISGKETRFAEDFLERIKQASFMDMSCGTGAFTYAYLSKINSLLATYRIDINLSDFTLNMYLNDIDNRAVNQIQELLRLSFDIDYLGYSGSCDALLDLRDKGPVSDVIHSGGFDIIIGNPPYLGEKGNAKIFTPLKNHPIHGLYYIGRMDYYYFFVHQSVDWVSKKGVVCLVTPSYFTTADSAVKLRNHLLDNCDFLLVRPNVGVFKDASLDVISYVLRKKNRTRAMCKIVVDDQFKTFSQSELYDNYHQLHFSVSNDGDCINEILSQTTKTLSDVLTIKQGFVTGADRVSKKMLKVLNEQVELNSPIFVFTSEEKSEDCHLKPVIKNSDITPLKINFEPKFWVLYSSGDGLARHENWQNHLAPYRAILEKRREVLLGRIPWYAMQWPRRQEIFESPKIIVPQRSNCNTFAYVKEPLYGSADVYFMILNQPNEPEYKAITAYLNSSLVYFWLYFRGKRKGEMLELYSRPLGQVPLIDFTEEQINALASIYDAYTVEDKNDRLDQMHEYVLTISGLSHKTCQIIRDFYKKRF